LIKSGKYKVAIETVYAFAKYFNDPTVERSSKMNEIGTIMTAQGVLDIKEAWLLVEVMFV
jgi:hypothetical protein